VVNIAKRWARRLLTSVRIEPAGHPAESTLDTFFAGVRWSEDRRPGGHSTLRLPSM
jgi:hypothetical protein